MAAEQVRVYEISTTAVSGLNNNEICSETVLDSDLNFYMWGGKDNAGNTTKWLSKDENAKVADLTVTGTAEFADGTVDTPSIASTTQPTTGIWFNGETINFSTAGVNRLLISSTGNIQFPTDSVELQFGASQDVKLIHTADTGLSLRAGITTTGAIFSLETTEDSVDANDVLGRINFSAPLEASGSDAIEVGASIVAIAEDTFYFNGNRTSLCFQTAQSEIATTKMILSSGGQVEFLDGVYDAPSISFISDPTSGIWYVGGSIMLSNVGYPSVEIDSGGQIILQITGGGLWFDVNVTNLRSIYPYGSDGGLELTAGDTIVGARLQLSTKETSVEANDVLGQLNFAAPSEASGGDSVLVGASIVAIAEDTFYYSGNQTSLCFRTANSELASTKAILNSAGNFGIGAAVTFDAEAVGCLALANATAPSAHTDNQIYIYSIDTTVGLDTWATLALYLEHPIYTDNISPSDYIPIVINGTTKALILGELPV